jgi:hypothetical protein
VNVTLVLPKSLRLPLLYTGIALVFALGCSGPSVPVETVVNVEATSCVDGARAMSFDIVSTSAMLPAVYQYGSANVIPIPTISGGGSSFHVLAGLTSGVVVGDQVSMTFTSGAFPNASISIQNIQFYTAVPSRIKFPACPPEHGPVIATSDTPGLGLHMEISNDGADPLIVDQMELAETPALLPASSVRWGDSDFEGLSWSAPIAPGIALAPGAPPIVVDLPELPTPGTVGALLRYAVHSGSGMEQRAIVQVDLIGHPVATEPSTWGAVKALYRGN